MVRNREEKGDGVRARIVSSRSGVLGAWTVDDAPAPANVERVEVKKGDTIDFVVDCRADVQFDGFIWAPVLRLAEATTADAPEWSASAGFSGPQESGTKLSPWEKYAQVLLMSDEFMFVD